MRGKCDWRRPDVSVFGETVPSLSQRSSCPLIAVIMNIPIIDFADAAFMILLLSGDHLYANSPAGVFSAACL